MGSTILHKLLVLCYLCTAVLASNGSAVFTYQKSSKQDFELVLSLDTTNSDIYFNMSAPSTFSWMGFGFGGQMKNSLMFIGYPNSNNAGMTLSPRLATGEKQPTYTSSKQVQLLSSSNNNNNGTYIIEAVCRNCTTWSLGTLDTSSTKQSFIFGLGPTSQSISSDSMTESISQHVMYGSFTLDMVQAASQNSNSANANVTSTSGNSSSASDPSTSSSMSVVNASGETLGAVHGIFMALAFVILFPLGVLALRLLESVLWHAIVQALAYIFVIVGFGTGIVLSQQRPYTQDYSTAHQIIGFVVFSAVTIQAALGLSHHLVYRRSRKPTVLGKIHLVLGPLVLILGIVNAPLGLIIAEEGRYNLAYGIVVGVLAVLFFAARGWKVWSNRRKARTGEKREKGGSRSDSGEIEALPSN